MSIRLVRMLVIAFSITGFAAADVSAQYRADPFTFVGTSAQCAPSPAGNKIVTASWQGGLGLPDNGTAHPDGTAHQGLLVSKNGPSPNCSAAGATINGITPGNPLTGLGFDFRRGSHCGAGAPRFNVYTNPAQTQGYFVGCSSGTHSNAAQDPAQWERVAFTAADFFPFGGAVPFVFGVTAVDSIDIIFDEGTDTATTDTEGVGLATLDNILINSTFIRKKGNNPITP